MRTLRPTQYLALLAALLVTAAGGYVGYQQFGPRTTVAAPIATTQVSRGSITSTVSATGSVASLAQTQLTFKSGGRVSELLVKVGDQVEAGQPLARLDSTDLQVALQQAQATYDSAVAKLDLSKAGNRPEDIAAAQADVESARVALAQKQAVPRSPEVAAAQSQVDSARIKLEQTQNPLATDIASAQATLDAANAKLQATLAPRTEDVATAQSQVTSAQSKLDALLHPRAEDVANARAGVVSAQAKLDALLHPRTEDIASAQSALDQAKTKLAQQQDHTSTATAQEIANAELAVNNAQVGYDKAIADANSGASGSTQADNDASIKQALIAVQTAQNSLQKLKEQGPSGWDVRQAQQAVDQAQATLDKAKTPSTQDVQQAQAALDQARLTLQKTSTPSDYDVQQAQEAVTQAQANAAKVTTPSPSDVASAQQTVATAQTALDKLLSPSDYDVRTAQESVTQAQANLQKLLTTNTYDVRTAQANLASAQAKLDKQRNGNTAQDIAQAQATVDQAAAALRQAQVNLDAATLVAPIPGVVTATGANAGENTSSGTSSTTSTASSSTTSGVVTLVDTRQVRVDLVVDEADIAKVQVGQDVTLTFDALTGKTLTGKVSVLAPTATTSSGVVTYQVRVEVDSAEAQAAGVRSGMTATAAIVTAKKDDAVLVPSKSLKTVSGAKTAEVLDPEGKTVARPVQTGIVGDQMTEIVSGLQAGDRVVTTATGTAGAARLPAGQPTSGGPSGGPPGGGLP